MVAPRQIKAEQIEIHEVVTLGQSVDRIGSIRTTECVPAHSSCCKNRDHRHARHRLTARVGDATTNIVELNGRSSNIGRRRGKLHGRAGTS